MRFLVSALVAMGFFWWVGDRFMVGSGVVEGVEGGIELSRDKSLPRGVRNNNPLNIRYNSANNWRGQVSDDGGYIVFDSAENGIRAAAKLLDNYYKKHGLKTVGGIVARWAPSFENDTNSYAVNVSEYLNVSLNEILLWPTVVPDLLEVMIQHENGMQPYSKDKILSGIKLAGL